MKIKKKQRKILNSELQKPLISPSQVSKYCGSIFECDFFTSNTQSYAYELMQYYCFSLLGHLNCTIHIHSESCYDLRNCYHGTNQFGIGFNNQS